MAKENNNYKPRLLVKYNEVVHKYLSDRLGIQNAMRIPKLEKVVLNMGLGDAKENKKWLTSGVEELTTIAGQKAVITISKKAISNFKIREGDPVGICVTLRGNKMYEFFYTLYPKGIQENISKEPGPPSRLVWRDFWECEAE